MAGGFGSYLIALDERTYKLIGVDYPGNRAEDVKNPGLLWMMGFIFVVSFLGLFSLVPLRKVYSVSISCFFFTADVAIKLFIIQNICDDRAFMQDLNSLLLFTISCK